VHVKKVMMMETDIYPYPTLDMSNFL